MLTLCSMSFQFFLDCLPKSEGWLAQWQLLVSTVAALNAIQNFVTLELTKRVYSGAAATVTPLQARTFAAWTMTSAVVRAYAAYHIEYKPIYDMALFTYLIAFGHFTSELLIFRTAKMNAGIIAPLLVASTTLVWMIKDYHFYIRA